MCQRNLHKPKMQQSKINRFYSEESLLFAISEFEFLRLNQIRQHKKSIQFLGQNLSVWCLLLSTKEAGVMEVHLEQRLRKHSSSRLTLLTWNTLQELSSPSRNPAGMWSSSLPVTPAGFFALRRLTASIISFPQLAQSRVFYLHLEGQKRGRHSFCYCYNQLWTKSTWVPNFLLHKQPFLYSIIT